jgi:hypothetical protein
LKQKLLEYKKKKQNNWKTPDGAQKRSQAKPPKYNSGQGASGFTQGSPRISESTRFANYYEHIAEKNQGEEEDPTEFLPKSSKFDYYLHGKEERDEQFELTGLEAQIIRSAFEDSIKDRMKSYLKEGDRETEMEGDIVPERDRGSEEEQEVTRDYIQQLKNKFESWHRKSDGIIDREIAGGRGVDRGDPDRLFGSNPRGSKLKVRKTETGDGFKNVYLRKKNYESELEKYRNQNMFRKKESEGGERETKYGNRVVQNRSSSRVIGKARRSKSMVFERLSQVRESKAQKMKKMREEYQEREMEGCTFTPQINRKKSVRKMRSVSRKKKKKEGEKGGVGERLFKEARKKEERMVQRRKEKEERETRQIQVNLKKGRSRCSQPNNQRSLGDEEKEKKRSCRSGRGPYLFEISTSAARERGVSEGPEELVPEADWDWVQTEDQPVEQRDGETEGGE